MTKKKNNPFDTKYQVFLILGDTSKSNIWANQAWSQFIKDIQPLTENCSYEGEGKIRHLVKATYDYVDYAPSPKWEKEFLESIPDLPKTMGFQIDEIEFSNHVFSFPSIQASLSEGFTPELVIHVEGTDRPGAGFDFAIYIAVRNDLLKAYGKRKTHALINKIAESINALDVFLLTRPWAFAIDEVAYSGAIQDENPVAIVKTLDPLTFFKEQPEWKNFKNKS